MDTCYHWSEIKILSGQFNTSDHYWSENAKIKHMLPSREQFRNNALKESTIKQQRGQFYSHYHGKEPVLSG